MLTNITCFQRPLLCVRIDGTLSLECSERLADKCRINVILTFSLLLKWAKRREHYFRAVALMGIWNRDSGNNCLPGACISDWVPGRKWCLSHQLCLFQNESHLPSPPTPAPAELFCALGNRAQFDDTLPKIHFDLSIATANNALALQVHEGNIVFIYQKLPPRRGCQGLQPLLFIQYFLTE